jgi:hypothetical protein
LTGEQRQAAALPPLAAAPIELPPLAAAPIKLPASCALIAAEPRLIPEPSLLE